MWTDIEMSAMSIYEVGDGDDDFDGDGEGEGEIENGIDVDIDGSIGPWHPSWH